MAYIEPFGDKKPQVASDVFLAATACVIGDVIIESQASIWYGTVLRGDVGAIRIGARTNVQDLSIVHMTGGRSDTILGEDVVVGHGAILHGVHVGNGALIGMGAILLDDARVGEGAVVAAGSVVPPNMEIPPYVMVRGTPARIVRELAPGERSMGRDGARGYEELAAIYRARVLGNPPTPS